MRKRKKFIPTPTQIILMSFLVAILLGSLLLSLPISSANGESVPYIDALFTATTSTCVTGLVTCPTVSTWSTFGHVVILVLIQIGGLGVITVISSWMFFLNRKMGLNEQLVIQESLNLNTMSGLKSFVKRMVIGTLIIEGIGAGLYMFVFVPEYGAKGIWISVFQSVSAFCNAGLDIMAENSLCDYATNPLVNIVTCTLIVLGGLGYIVWWDVLKGVKRRLTTKKKFFKYLTMHSKIVLTITPILIVAGAALIFTFEYSNPATIGDMSLFNKIQVSFFQAITARTAGFASVPQENLTKAGAFVSMLLMLVGGSPVGTAGGMKTVTVAVLLSSSVAMIRKKESATLFRRRIPHEGVSKAIAIAVTFIAVGIVSSALLLATQQNVSGLDLLYEAVSALSTTGLSRNLTPNLNLFGKIVIITTMYFGRVGPISLVVALGSTKKNKSNIIEPTGQISVG